ncbi:MAG: methyl-accepting chemotaxis protein, partial [Nitrososphaerota archaeon]
MKISLLIKLVLLLLFFSLTGTCLMFVFLTGTTDDGRVVNYAGIVRGGTQRLIKLELSNRSSDELIATLDKIITGLSEGSKELHLPKITDAKFISKLDELRTKWTSLKELIKNHRQDKTLSGKLLEESEAYFKLTNEFVSVTEEYSKRKVVVARIMQIAILSLNAALLVLVLIVMQKKLIKPLSNFSILIQNISEGDLTVSLNIKGKDEISQLGNQLNRMIQSFSGIINKILQAVLTVVDSADKLRETTEKSLEGARNLSSQT